MCVRRAGADCSARVFCLRCSTARNPDRFGGASAASHVPNIIQNCDIHFSAEPSSSAEISPRNSGKSPLTHHIVSGSQTVISNCLMRYGVAAVRGCSGLDPRVGPDPKAICELWRWLGPNGTRPPATTPTHSNRTRPASARNLSTSGKLSCALHTSGAVSRSHDFPANTTQVSSPHFGQEGMAIGARRQFGLESE